MTSRLEIGNWKLKIGEWKIGEWKMMKRAGWA
jgi:hypothetical protein